MVMSCLAVLWFSVAAGSDSDLDRLAIRAKNVNENGFAVIEDCDGGRVEEASGRNGCGSGRRVEEVDLKRRMLVFGVEWQISMVIMKNATLITARLF